MRGKSLDEPADAASGEGREWLSRRGVCGGKTHGSPGTVRRVGRWGRVAIGVAAGGVGTAMRVAHGALGAAGGVRNQEKRLGCGVEEPAMWRRLYKWRGR